ncbi:TPM domain-containing protein, partial [Sphingomonas sp. ERG5]|uniref:TPM domain-containing protein n=1 Tax=Sphingomonas sp. ERG5 TaxID=1381597 RepID=UPI00068FD7D8
MNILRYLVASLLLCCATLASAQTFPPLSGRVVDAANILAPEQEAQLNQLAVDIEKASSRQFVVATVPDLQGYPIEDYGYKLGRAWKIGQKDANNGIILLIAPTERKVRIEVGYGLEPIMTDALSGMIIRDTILPEFRKGDMAGGIVAGANAIGEQMKLPLEAAEARAQKLASERPAAKSSSSSGNGAAIAIFWIIILFFVVFPMIFGRARGSRYRNGASPVIIWGPGLGGGGGGGSSWGS